MKRFPRILFLLGLALFVGPAVALVLTLMPVIPALQELESLAFSYAIYSTQYIWSVIGLIALGYSTPLVWKRSRWLGKTVLILALLLSVGVNIVTRTKMSAEAMFNEPFTVQRELRTLDSTESDETVYIWVRSNGAVAGYKLDLVAHHHKIMDTVGGTAVMVTYCTMCHTGRVFSPLVNGVSESFRLVGANHFNAVFEDRTTGSWWYQATGECVVGPLKGAVLASVESIHGTISEMKHAYGLSSTATFTTFVSDTATGERYSWAKGYSTIVGDTTFGEAGRALVLGIRVGSLYRSYSVVNMIRAHANTYMHDTLGGVHLVWYVPTKPTQAIIVYRDSVSSSTIHPSTVEYRHAWQAFHPR